MRALKWGPSAFAVSVVALVMSLGGTGWAMSASAGSAPPSARPAWHQLKLTGGWTYGGYGSYHAGYYKDSSGVVHLRGSALGGSIGLTAFRLPKGDRPSHTLWLPVYAYQGSAGGLEIDSNGKSFFFDASNGGNVTQYASLDGVSFPVP